MRYTILIIILSITHIFGKAQSNIKEENVVQAQIDAFFASWNKHDFNDMKNYVADTSDWVNIVGMHWKGRKDIQYAHQTMHQQLFKDRL